MILRKNIKLSYQIRFNFREVKAKLTRMKAQSRKTFKVFEKKKLTNVYLSDKISKNNI